MYKLNYWLIQLLEYEVSRRVQSANLYMIDGVVNILYRGAISRELFFRTDAQTIQ